MSTITSTTVPAVYVGTYHKYNCGSIYGQWFDLTDFDDEADFFAACQRLHADEADPELMFQDWEGFPDGIASESQIDWDFIAAYQQARDEGRDAAFMAWVDYTGDIDYDSFEDAYCGEADSEEDFAVSLVEESGMLSEVPECLRRYFDYDAYARDLFCDGYFMSDGFVFHH
ncbi:antirestriction protein ArdA (plasmid) [Salmonella enterica subsp. enterica serovar Karamoja]|uniref:Antirestriction protein ArdA n=1 Tax=Salmonella enterica subsp. enterica serovar Karamoja TaxID=2500153 RepID=A0A3T0CI64_SALET|nr:antirestriction protein ArdA [Salmonella enterica]AZT39620.1 antirestriction protein ArdA [Salmonella enterica subsp. enterica serovar Karamoja]AZT44296.1 antirestriction protein ArdA [Salmonella enterica subsp. enterica serovar Karamoja]